MKHVLALIRFTWRYFSAMTVAGAVLYCVVPLLLGLSTREVFDRIGGEGAGPVWMAIAIVGALRVSEVLSEVAIGRMWSGFCYETYTLLQRNLLAGILRGFGRHGLPVPPGDAISRFRDEPPRITMGSMDGLSDLLGRALFAVVGGAVMWSIDPLLTLAAFSPVIVSSLASDALGTRAARHGWEARRASAQLSAFLGDILSANLAVRAAGATPHVVRRLDQLGEQRRRRSLADRVLIEVVNSFNYHLQHVGTGAVLLLGAAKIRTGAFSVGELAMFVVYLDQLTYLPAEIGRVLTELKQTKVSLDRLHELVPGSTRDEVVAHAPIYVRRPLPELPPVPAAECFERLDVEGLTSVYPSSGRGVHEVSFALERGSFTVVTGRVGSGKTTLLHALLGLVPRDAGEIRWNGEAVAEPAERFVPPRVAFTPQVPRLFSDSLRANLVLGRPPADDAPLHRAVHAAVLERDVELLDAGLDTMVGRRGVKLSGGQVQRAAAARMFLRDADLLVFDDLSSALDVDTETELWRRLLERRCDVTCLVVSHSPIAMAAADQLLVLGDGRARGPAGGRR